ncbi:MULTISPECIES: GNAT family N-acetyltransferase [Staphylococcus]|uniref:GCN5-related N-acetyltransferase n=1 Tax=Staphylococcus nepalensis TaxID=214473 RepID=A0A2T4S7F7_9STAP|nr:MULTISPECIES: GNAT family N-acetyltransferase [Staphylococcus]MBO1204569.1 GNAT family N-acetyltransferase [Staphylococcus nepalensis]MBO1213949.1 GNAT family N-acetyltransferase [Staphylococcus nepalensis]MBO1216999.1 GNAT family N-acetyltransferase [Staphylococcus nepalensis]MBO1220377.1 GNAT family N-acetyltransferase [Staphylococcus nepalensis]MBO1227917.1 GNAT family N-acetyltransferase [Staphylococcus nepalensis]
MFKIVNTSDMLNDAYEIRKKVFVLEQGVPLENEIDQFESSSTHVIGYDNLQSPFATGRFRTYKNGAKIERVAILASHRKLGYGKSLMQFIEAAAKEADYHTLTLNAQCHAQHFYETLGYTTFGDVFLEENIEHIVMTKTI